MLRLFLFLTMHYFLDPAFDPELGILNESESYHALKSLRLHAGAHIEIGDGKGNRYACRILDTDGKRIRIEVFSKKFFEIEKPALTIALAPTKNPSRFEWFLEKATELGVHEIIPLNTQRTQRPRFKQARAEKIILEASKQSRRHHLPVLRGFTSFRDVLATQHRSKYIAHCEDDNDKNDFATILRRHEFTELVILIGPEGDFTSEEICEARGAGWEPVSLGHNRLRTETAGIYAASMVYGLNFDK